jgi:hypothetical protein
LAMAPVTLAAIPLTRRLAEGLEASQQKIDAERNGRHG